MQPGQTKVPVFVDARLDRLEDKAKLRLAVAEQARLIVVDRCRCVRTNRTAEIRKLARDHSRSEAATELLTDIPGEVA